MPTSDTAASSWVCPSPAPDRSRARDGVWAPIILFTLIVLTLGTVGCTPGKRLFGLRVVALATGRVHPLRALLRTILLFLALPALIWDRDGRGLHDRMAGTVEIRV